VTPEQAWAVAQAVPLFERTILIAAAVTACRISEVLALKWFDIEWQLNQIRIRRAWVRGSKIGKPKSKSSRAPVAMHPLLASILQSWRRETMYAKDNDWVFPSIRKKGTQPRTATTMVSDYIRPAAEKLGIIDTSCKRFGFHNFRHSLATFLIREGQNPDVVRKMLRQSHINTTLIYTHMDTERINAQGRFLEKMVPATARTQ
jgi:integrase